MPWSSWSITGSSCTQPGTIYSRAHQGRFGGQEGMAQVTAVSR